MARVKPASRFQQGPAPASWPNNIDISVNRTPHFVLPRAEHQPKHRDPARAAARKKEKATQRVAKLKAARLRARADKKAARLHDLGLTEGDVDWTRFQRDWCSHIHLCQKWVQSALSKHRFNTHVAEELKEYYFARKTHQHIAPAHFSHQMRSAVKSCDLELGTDVEWAKKASRGWGRWGDQVVGMIEDMGEDEAFSGYSPLWDVGESDLNSEVGEDRRRDGDGSWRGVVEEGDEIVEVDGDEWLLANCRVKMGKGNEGEEVLEYVGGIKSSFPNGRGDVAFPIGGRETSNNSEELVCLQWTGEELGEMGPVGNVDFDFNSESSAVERGHASIAGDGDMQLDIDMLP